MLLELHAGEAAIVAVGVWTLLNSSFNLAFFDFLRILGNTAPMLVNYTFFN